MTRDQASCLGLGAIAYHIQSTNSTLTQRRGERKETNASRRSDPQPVPLKQEPPQSVKKKPGAKCRAERRKRRKEERAERWYMITEGRNAEFNEVLERDTSQVGFVVY